MSFPCAQAYARQQPQLFGRKVPIPGLGCELDEGSMQGTSGGSNHFSIVVVADVQKDRHAKINRPAVDLKRDANLRIRLAATGPLDACHLDLEFAHRFIRAAAADPNTRSARRT